VDGGFGPSIRAKKRKGGVHLPPIINQVLGKERGKEIVTKKQSREVLVVKEHTAGGRDEEK